MRIWRPNRCAWSPRTVPVGTCEMKKARSIRNGRSDDSQIVVAPRLSSTWGIDSQRTAARPVATESVRKLTERMACRCDVMLWDSSAHERAEQSVPVRRTPMASEMSVSLIRVQQPAPDRVLNEVRLVPQPDFPHQVRAVRLRGARRDVETHRDFRRRLTFGGKHQHLAFP